MLSVVAWAKLGLGPTIVFHLTHWGQDKMDDIFKRILLNEYV